MISNIYPFSAVVGQEKVKKALIYNLINPQIGGVLLCGQKGTAKSTLVRSLAEISNKKIVELPLNVTEDMLVGSIDFEKAVKNGKKVFSEGILAKADKNILYADEVNLLPDGIISTLICTAAEGENHVEREGISYVHSSSFVLIGTMNPEEGKLRPQFLDRFGLYVNVNGEEDLDKRTEIIYRRMEYEKNPILFSKKYEKQTLEIAEKIKRAKELLPNIKADENIRRLASQYAITAGCQGNRCEIILIQTAKSVASWDNREYITADDLKEAAFYVLPHRKNEDAENNQDNSQKQNNSSDENKESDSSKETSDNNDNEMPSLEENEGNDGESFEMPAPEENTKSPTEEQTVAGDIFSVISALPELPRDRVFRQGSGRRAKTKSGSNKGRYASYTSVLSKKSRDLAIDATLRAAAPYQKYRDHSISAVSLTKSDLRYKIRESHVGATIVFAVDASGSMGAKKRMKVTKETIISMLMDSYQKRDKIGLVAFKGKNAEALLEITNSVELAQKQLQNMSTGGKTPLASGIFKSWQLLKAAKLKDPEILPMLVLVTDGRANCPLLTDDPVEDALKVAENIRNEGIHAVVIDTEKEFISLHIAKQIADKMGADYYKVDELHKEGLKNIVHCHSQIIGSKEHKYGKN